MKIYQIHESGGEYEDYYDYIRFTYLDKEKAETKKEELEAQELLDRMCDSCPLDNCYDGCDNDCKNCRTDDVRINNAIKHCNRCDIEQIEDEDYIDGHYIRCKNKSDHYDDNIYSIEEADVIE